MVETAYFTGSSYLDKTIQILTEIYDSYKKNYESFYASSSQVIKCAKTLSKVTIL